jgi:hypothetical protein
MLIHHEEITEVTPGLSPVFERLEPSTLPLTVKFEIPLATGFSVIAS